MLNIYEIRRANVLRITNKITRKKLAALIEMEYGLLNQYLREKKPKNFGQDTTLRITKALNLPDGWLDHLQDDTLIDFLFSDSENGAPRNVAQQSDSHLNNDLAPVNNLINDYKIIKVSIGLLVKKGENLEITSNITETYSVHYPDNLKNPMAFLVIGNGQRKPFKNGWVLICEQNADPIEGEDCLFFTKDKKVFVGEVLFNKDGFVEIEDIFGERDTIKIEEITKISPVKVYVAPSQKIKNSY
ncbi:hypothetical protein [Acinetobacter nosocomialis]|uniref:hypothetical protein n=1 Tax=Acinetobacter nosocomialis TaxID=106654 RepID=UPI0039876439